jgi:serine/threonine protein kinase
MSLAQRLEECQRQGLTGIPLAELLDYMTSAARAIDYLNQPVHALGGGPRVAIRHGDIRPANLLIVGNGLQVCDYGLARALTSHVCAAQVAGAPAYMAPELIAGRPNIRTDQYSLAITYYELRTGRLPFDEALSLFQLMLLHSEGTLDFSRLPPADQAVLRKATHLKPDQRYPSCMEFVRELEQAAA